MGPEWRFGSSLAPQAACDQATGDPSRELLEIYKVARGSRHTKNPELCTDLWPNCGKTVDVEPRKACEPKLSQSAALLGRKEPSQSEETAIPTGAWLQVEVSRSVPRLFTFSMQGESFMRRSTKECLLT